MLLTKLLALEVVFVIHLLLNVFVIYLLVKSLTIISGFVCNATKILKEFLLFLRATYILFLHTKIKNWRCNVQTKCNPLTTQKSSFFQRRLFTLHSKENLEYIMNSVKMRKRPLFFSNVCLRYIQKKTLNIMLYYFKYSTQCVFSKIITNDWSVF